MKHRKNTQKNSFDTSLYLAHNALEQIARREGKKIEHVRKHVQLAMMSGLLSEDASVQETWTCIPPGEIPSPEEVIAHYTSKLFLKNKAIPRRKQAPSPGYNSNVLKYLT